MTYYPFSSSLHMKFNTIYLSFLFLWNANFWVLLNLFIAYNSTAKHLMDLLINNDLETQMNIDKFSYNSNRSISFSNCFTIRSLVFNEHRLDTCIEIVCQIIEGKNLAHVQFFYFFIDFSRKLAYQFKLFLAHFVSKNALLQVLICPFVRLSKPISNVEK